MDAQELGGSSRRGAQDAQMRGGWGEIQGSGTFRASVRNVPTDALLCFENLDSLPGRGRF